VTVRRPSPGKSSRTTAASRRRLVVGALVLAALVLVTLSFREADDGPVTRAQNGAAAVLRPFQVAADRIAEPFRDAYAWVDSLFDARSDAERLREENEALRQQVDGSALPIVETGHRVVGSDRCHFSAPASMPDDPAQPAGRLLLTDRRAVFVGGARVISLPWHSIGEALRSERDVVLTGRNREQLYRFRCNSFTDATRGVFLAERLAASRQPTVVPRSPRPTQ